MDSYYDDKLHHRRRELNSSGNSGQIDDRQYKNQGNKKIQLVREMMDDFHPDSSGVSFQCAEPPALQASISLMSDDDNVEFRAMTTPDIANTTGPAFSAITTDAPAADIVHIAEWITTDNRLSITPLFRRYKNYHAMINKCREAEPVVDTTIFHDLQKAFDNLSPMELYKTIPVYQLIPYWIRADDGPLMERMAQLRSDFNLTEPQFHRMHEIVQKILYRSSFGVLFVQGDRFFAKTHKTIKKRRTAIKGYSLMKANGEWENPWETAVRMTESEVQCRSHEQEEWQSFNMEEYIKEDDRQNYLECLRTGIQNTDLLRYIGLFIIRLKPNIQIAIKDFKLADSETGWYSIPENVENSRFYIVCPFLKYLQEHRDFI